MAIENTLLLKISGGLVAAGGATTVGVVYKDDISKWFNQKEKTYLYLVASKTGTKGSTQKELYESTTKESNYECQLNGKTYACEIVKTISKADISTKKWLNLSSSFDSPSTETNLQKNIFDTENNFYLLKIIDKNKPTLTWAENEIFDVVEKSNGSPKFGQLKPIFGKEGNTLLGKINLFLVKIKSFEANNTTGFTKTANKKYKCSFINANETPTSSNQKPCEINKFAKETQSSPNANSNYDSINFIGKAEVIGDNTALKQHEYYLVKFINDLSVNDYSGKELIYFEEESNPKKEINFSNISASFLFNPTPSTDDGKLLIIS